jgi:hypothetical protein
MQGNLVYHCYSSGCDIVSQAPIVVSGGPGCFQAFKKYRKLAANAVVAG